MPDDLTEGVSATSPRQTLFERLVEAKERLNSYVSAEAKQQHDAKVADLTALAEIERLVSEKMANAIDTEDVAELNILGTEEEFRVVYEFLDNWGDKLPLPLQRIWRGAGRAAGVATESKEVDKV